MNHYKFPKNFYWGSSISSHQSEGNNQNSDWYKWEIAGNIAKKEISGMADDHWHRYKEDLDIAKSLGQNIFRFSIEWAKIQPEKNRWNFEAIKHYQDEINYCRKIGIEPFVTLHHFTIPQWFADIKGWENDNAPQIFAIYVEKIVSIIEGVDWWATLNEPEILALQSYLLGAWPPQKRGLGNFWKVIKNLVRVHNKAYETIKKYQPKTKVGIVTNNVDWDYKYWPIDYLISKVVKYYWNHYALDHTKNDFIGLNYYMHNKIHFQFAKPHIVIKNDNKSVSDLGWEIYPKGIYHTLIDLKRYNVPIFITENGLADAKDKLRECFIVQHLYWVNKAISDNVKIKGYMHWSLLDNFEWDKGFSPRFGLVEVNYATQKRTIRSSAKTYAMIAKNNEIPEELVKKYI